MVFPVGFPLRAMLDFPARPGLPQGCSKPNGRSQKASMKKFRKPKAKRRVNFVPCLIEPMDHRLMFSVATPHAAESSMVTTMGLTTLGMQPSVADVNPADGATNVARDIFISCDLNLLQNAGSSEVDPDTLAGNVTLTKTSDSANVHRHSQDQRRRRLDRLYAQRLARGQCVVHIQRD